jgi:hypothetical protein
MNVNKCSTIKIIFCKNKNINLYTFMQISNMKIRIYLEICINKRLNRKTNRHKNISVYVNMIINATMNRSRYIKMQIYTLHEINITMNRNKHIPVNINIEKAKTSVVADTEIESLKCRKPKPRIYIHICR